MKSIFSGCFQKKVSIKVISRDFIICRHSRFVSKGKPDIVIRDMQIFTKTQKRAKAKASKRWQKFMAVFLQLLSLDQSFPGKLNWD